MMNLKLFRQLRDAEWSGLLLIVLAGLLVIGLLKPGFLSIPNVRVLLLAIAINMLVSSSQMVIIAIGQMNLSVGAIGGLAAISFAGMMDLWSVPPLIAAGLALVVGLVAGIINGYLIAMTGISAFIITLATLSIFKGVNLGLTKAVPFYGIPGSVSAFGNGALFGFLPYPFILALLISMVLWYFLNHIRMGRQILAVGASFHAAELAGISLRETQIWAHAVSGVLAAAAGILLVARLQVGHPSIGDDWLILSFAGPVIGGAVLAGGKVNTIGTFLGVVIIAIITQVLVVFEIDPFIVQVVLGGLILWAVGMNRLREVRQQAGKGVF